MSAERVIAYIDGYNFYYGLRDARLRSSRWLDFSAMCRALLKDGQQLDLVRYFTTRVRNNAAAAKRQSTFIDALIARGGIEIDFGHFISKNRQCKSCDHKWQQSEEKKTDVNIAVRLLEDAYDDRFDTAIVISGDSDLVPAIKAVRARFPCKRLVVASPPERVSEELRGAANTAITIYERTIRANRLPNPVVTSTGIQLWAPDGWLPRR